MPDCTVKSFAKKLYQKTLKTPLDHNQESTRSRILEAAFDEMYEHGYQGMRIETILKKTQLAKGALYHHFKSKKALGYAVVDEVIFNCKKAYFQKLDDAEDPLTALCEIMMHCAQEMTTEELSLGCPLNNLIQEMYNLDDGFGERLSNVYQYCHNTIKGALVRGQTKGLVKQDIDPEIITLFLMSSMHGISGTAKCMQSIEVLKKMNATLCDYLNTLRA